MKGKTCRTIICEIVNQKTKKDIALRMGSSKIDKSCRHLAAEEVALNTKNLSVKTVANPKRESFTQINQPNQKLKATPKMIKTSHIPQQTADRTRVLRIENIGSFFSRDLLMIVLVTTDITKREMPKYKLTYEGKTRKTQKLITMMQIAATAKIAVLYDGRKNIEE